MGWARLKARGVEGPLPCSLNPGMGGALQSWGSLWVGRFFPGMTSHMLGTGMWVNTDASMEGVVVLGSGWGLG